MSQITFTRDDVKEAVKWLDFVHKNAKWGSNISSAEAQDIGRFFNWCHKHAKMLNDHIFELVEHIPAPAEESEVKPQAPAPKRRK